MNESSRANAVSLTPENFRVHVIHYTRLVERRVHMERVLVEHGLDRFPLNWVLDHDREEVPVEALGSWVLGAGDPRGRGLVDGPLNGGHVSVIRKHMAVFQSAAGSAAPFHLVLEDDVLLVEAFVERLGMMLGTLPPDWEIVFVGDGCRLHVPWWKRCLAGREEKQSGAYFRGWKPAWWGGGGMSRCAAGYVIRPGSARRFLSSTQSQPPFEVPIDWMMNRVGRELKFRSYWAEPPLVNQDYFGSWTKNPALA